MRNLMIMSGLALAIASPLMAADIGQPIVACAGADCPTNTFEPQPIATTPEAAAPAAFVPPTPTVTPAATMQAAPTQAAPMAMDHSTMSMPTTTSAGDAASASTKALMDANAKMHSAMSGPFTGDADVDFVRGMIAHHQGAIDMAKVELTYGKDPDMKMLANDIIKAQMKEIEQMNTWLDLHGPKTTAAPAKAAKPRPPVMKAKAKPIGELLDAADKAKVAPNTALVVSSTSTITTTSSSVVPATGAAPAASLAVPSADTEMAMPLLDDMAPLDGVSDTEIPASLRP